MKFRFCGELDCPDWIVAEISHLSKLTSIKVRILSQEVTAVLTGQDLKTEKIFKLTEESGYDITGVKGIVAALEFILSSAAKNLCDAHSLCSELEQLGLPSEHSNQLCKIYETKRSAIAKHLLSKSLRLPTAKISQVDYVESAPGKKSERFPVLNLSVLEKDSEYEMSVAVPPQKLSILCKELRDGLEVLDNLNPENT